jgi:cytochrome c-type biogenesis protein CcsB
LYLSKRSQNYFDTTLDVAGKQVRVHLQSYVPNAHYEAVADPKGIPVANMMITAGGGGEQVSLKKGDFYEANDVVIDFGSQRTFQKPVIALSVEGDHLVMETPMELKTLSMDTRESSSVAAGKTPLAARTLFQSAQTSFVLRSFLPTASMRLVSQPSKAPMAKGDDALSFDVTSGKNHAKVVALGSPGVVGEKSVAVLGDMSIDVTYGSIERTLPFAIALNDFQLERYPGSLSPASYASEVTLIDKNSGVTFPFRIYMNHILDYEGFRFFQSSYDQDEQGTVLSVNKDPGTIITYIGYLLLAFGLFAVLLLKNGRFAQLSQKLTKLEGKKLVASLAVMVMVMIGSGLHAEENPVITVAKSFDADHADKFGHLVIQDASGRMKPLDTLSHEIVAKLNRSDGMLGLSPNQIVLGMMLRPDAWREIAMIKTGNPEINKRLGLPPETKIAAFSQFFDSPADNSGYKIADLVDAASRKAPAKQDKLDKALLQVDERVNVAYMVYTGSLIQMWPKPNDPQHKWDATIDALQTFPPRESEMVRIMAVNYFTAVDEALKSGNWAKADKALSLIDKYQHFVGASIYPDATKISVEIVYNKTNIFEQLWPLYFLVGFALLIISFAKILNPSIRFLGVNRIAVSVLGLLFAAHTIGLVMRWYIAGHAPWSNGYESMIYIGWATMLAGFIFARKSLMTLAATGMMAGLILFVAHLNWMDPQVTNLVPVLQSYWLSIHVSMITASYGFLGLSALLGMISLILFILKNPHNAQRLNHSIKELNAINEMTLLVGLILLTVGNFLGGVWANESWGRYWGWDPKETWALVTILVYAVVVHLRMIKGAYTDFSFSVISLLAFTSVLMTYFGVNYYLAGMHSYAKGDPVPIPDFVPWTYAVIAILIAMAYPKRSTK